MATQIGINNALLPVGSLSLPERMLIYHQWSSVPLNWLPAQTINKLQFIVLNVYVIMLA